MVEHLFRELEGFVADFVTFRSIPQHEEYSHKRVLPPNYMMEHLHQPVIGSGALPSAREDGGLL